MKRPVHHSSRSMEAKKFLNDDDEESTVIIGDSFARSKSERIRERVLRLESSKIRPIAPRIETQSNIVDT